MSASASITVPRAFSLARASASTTTSARAVTLRPAAVPRASRVVMRAAEPSPNVSETCSIDEVDSGNCNLADLEMLYIDALWNYYNGGDFTLSDSDYDRLREELNWQGSGFPTLRRYEVEFVQAAISFARGEPVVSDDKYEELKRRVKAEGKRVDVTALLLYTKGQQLLDAAQYESLAEEMKKLGIEVGLRGATCTLSTTPPKLENDVAGVFQMYLALGIAPTIIGLLPYVGISLVGADVPPAFSLGFAATFAVALTAKLVNYTNLQNGEILTGQCPCCEADIKQFFGGETPADTFDHKCSVCGTQVTLDRKQKMIISSDGLGSA